MKRSWLEAYSNEEGFERGGSAQQRARPLNSNCFCSTTFQSLQGSRHWHLWDLAKPHDGFPYIKLNHFPLRPNWEPGPELSENAERRPHAFYAICLMTL
ncbi:Hypothetical protein NTJ_03342 [Nesidiocoris tenuis]|uniref:Uncharacterized protein n=1 Tax=Nesidiocoris tenuis TaxID=355587 RepID=A0ABN7AEX5_9HEMI|nr:Hypothetical protein NTJ_03342 [Nesidiocoris tenuis]